MFFYKFILFIYVWLYWVFVAARGLSLVASSGGYSSLRSTSLSPRWPLSLRSAGSRHTGSVVVARGPQSAGSAVVAHGLSCSVACGILLDQGSNPCPLHWQADSQPLRHQGSPLWHVLKSFQNILPNCPLEINLHSHRQHRSLPSPATMLQHRAVSVF